jgi:hypothetical protein
MDFSNTQHVVHSSNIFIDSSYNVTGNGLEFEVSAQDMITVPRNADFIRLHLTEFSMPRNFHKINSKNNLVFLNITTATIPYTFPISIPVGDYVHPEVIGEATAKAIQDTINENAVLMGLTGPAAVLNANMADSNDNTVMHDNVLRISGTVQREITGMIFFFLKEFEAFGNQTADLFKDTYKILGGRLTKDYSKTNTLINGLEVNFAPDGINPTPTTITGYYPMVTSTIDHVYLRTELQNDNLTNHQDNTFHARRGDLTNSNIFAKCVVHENYVSFDNLSSQSNGSGGYYVNVPYKSVNRMRFTLTDADGLLLPVIDKLHSTNGNFACSMVIRVDYVSAGGGY